MKIGILVRFTGVDTDLGIGMIAEKRIQGGYWAYFPKADDYFAITKHYDDWEYV
jgi:hypothetical protein